jgi:hypothetical protein
MTKRLPLPIWTRIIAVRNFGRVREGQPGIITGIAEERYLETFRPVYLCRFANNVKIAAQSDDIERYNHKYSLADLEKSQF